MDVLLTLAVIAVVVLLATLAAYNGLAGLRQDVRDAWAAMDAELRRRSDLLPPLAAAVRATGEPSPVPLAAVLAAKNQAAVAFNPHQLAEAEAALSSALEQLFAAPPATLAGNPAFARCRADLATAGDRMAAAGRRYNAAVHAYNAARVSFPHDAVAATFDFKPQPTFGPGDG